MTMHDPNDATLRAAYAKLLDAREMSADSECLPLEQLHDLADGTITGQARLDMLDRVLADPVMRDEYYLLRAVVEKSQRDGVTGKNVRGRSARWIAAAASLLLLSGLGIWVQRGTDPRREPFRGTAVAVMLVRPAADAPLRDGTKFEWRALARAENYELLVMDTDGKPVVRLETTDTFASVPDGLPAQGQWIVTARLPDGTTERSAARPFASAR